MYTLKKIGALPNPPKRFGRFEKVCKWIESSKKRIKKSTKPLKDLPLGTREDPFFLETFLSSVEQKISFCRQIRNWESFVLNIMVLYETHYETMRFHKKIFKFRICLKSLFFALRTLKRFREKKDLPVCPGEDPLKVS